MMVVCALMMDLCPERHVICRYLLIISQRLVNTAIGPTVPDRRTVGTRAGYKVPAATATTLTLAVVVAEGVNAKAFNHRLNQKSGAGIELRMYTDF